MTFATSRTQLKKILSFYYFIEQRHKFLCYRGVCSFLLQKHSVAKEKALKNDGCQGKNSVAKEKIDKTMNVIKEKRENHEK